MEAIPDLVLHRAGEVVEVDHQGNVFVPHVTCVVILYNSVEEFRKVWGGAEGRSCK